MKEDKVSISPLTLLTLLIAPFTLIFVFLFLCLLSHMLEDVYKYYCLGGLLPKPTEYFRHCLPDGFHRALTVATIIWLLYFVLGGLFLFFSKDKPLFLINYLAVTYSITIVFALIGLFLLLVPFIPTTFVPPLSRDNISPQDSFIDTILEIILYLLGIFLLTVALLEGKYKFITNRSKQEHLVPNDGDKPTPDGTKKLEE